MHGNRNKGILRRCHVWERVRNNINNIRVYLLETAEFCGTTFSIELVSAEA